MADEPGSFEPIGAMPYTMSLEHQAGIVWAAARKGRLYARNGMRATAYVIMERLDAVAESSRCFSLQRIARDAAVDIDNILESQ